MSVYINGMWIDLGDSWRLLTDGICIKKMDRYKSKDIFGAY